MKQPEALILAEIMDAKGSRQRNELGDYWDDSWCNKAAAELRRLHEVNTELLEALELIVTWNRDHARDQYGDPNKAESWACVRAARAAITKATGEQK
jgi:hypothetical protein